MFFKKEKSKQQEKGDFYLGVQKIFRIENSADLLAAGKVNGTIYKGAAIYITNPGEDSELTELTTVTEIIINNNSSPYTRSHENTYKVRRLTFRRIFPFPQSSHIYIISYKYINLKPTTRSYPCNIDVSGENPLTACHVIIVAVPEYHFFSSKNEAENLLCNLKSG